MIPHSAAFDDAIRGGPRVVQRLTAFRGGEPVLDGLDGVGLQVQVDETAACVRQLSGAIADPDGLLYPHLATDPLAPYGVELFVEIGVEVLGGVEYVPAGMFRLQAGGGGSTKGPIVVKGKDRAAVIARARDEQPYVIPGSTSLGDGFTAYAQSKYPGLVVLCDPDSFSVKLPPTPTVFLSGPQQQTDPWGNLAGLAAAYGRQAVIDAVGELVLRPVPDATNTLPCYAYLPGADNISQAAAPIQDTTGVHNVWVVRWEGTGVVTPEVVVVEITDPTSPIFPALFGRSPTFFTSQLFTSVDQMTAYGLAQAAQALGDATSVPFVAGAHPAHEPGDVVTYDSDEGDTHATLALSKWTLACDLRTPSTYTTRVLS